MAVLLQLSISPALFTSATGAKSALAPTPLPKVPSNGNDWARQVPGNGSAGHRRIFSSIDRKWVHACYVLLDIFLISFNCLAAFYLRYATLPIWHFLRTKQVTLDVNFPLKPYLGFLFLYDILIVLLCQSQDLYRTRRGRSAVQESWAVVRAVTIGTFLLSAFIFSSNVKIVSREVVGVSAILNVVTLILWRVQKRKFVTRRVEQGIGARNALIVGSGEVAKGLAEYLERNKQLGYKVVGFLDGDQNGNNRILGKIEDLSRIARAQFVDEVFVTIASERELVKRVAAEARRQHLNVKVIPELYDGLARNAPIQQFGEFPVMELHWESIPTVGLFVKRITDAVLSAIALGVLSPLLLALALAIKLDSRGGVLYRSKRVGRKGKTFTCYKFRTMVLNADDLKAQLHHLNERSNGLLFKMENDPRVTRLGKFLRKYSLDELPQFWNVLRGDMSLVGPRPPLPAEFDQYSLEHLRRLDVKPGITGFWQVTGRLDPSFENYMALDLEYIEKWGFWLDTRILWKTIPAVLKGQGR